MYANNYNGHLPMEQGGGFWLWDIPVNMQNDPDDILASDAQLEQNGDFYNVVGGFNTVPNHTNHIKSSGYKPDGGNILFLDCHGEWRDFSEMQNRAASGNVYFWF